MAYTIVVSLKKAVYLTYFRGWQLTHGRDAHSSLVLSNRRCSVLHTFCVVLVIIHVGPLVTRGRKEKQLVCNVHDW